MTTTRHELVLPDLDLGEVPLVASVWHVAVGGDVSQGESVLEVLAGEFTVDLPAPVSGVLIERFVAEDEPLHAGQVLGMILVSPSEVD